MIASQLYALMTCRRMMGDIGAEVVLRREDFVELVRDVRSSRPYIEVDADGKFTINTCQGPTIVRTSRA